MPTTRTRLLRRLRNNVFQVIIGDRIAAVLRQTNAHTIEIWTLADEARLLITLVDPTRLATDVARVALRIAESEFDNDFRFEYSLNPEPSSNADLYFITQIATPSQKVIDSWTTEDPGAAIEAARETQLYSLEERWAMDAEAGR